jgi:hypothetical protein
VVSALRGSGRYVEDVTRLDNSIGVGDVGGFDKAPLNSPEKENLPYVGT